MFNYRTTITVEELDQLSNKLLRFLLSCQSLDLWSIYRKFHQFWGCNSKSYFSALNLVPRSTSSHRIMLGATSLRAKKVWCHSWRFDKFFGRWKFWGIFTISTILIVSRASQIVFSYRNEDIFNAKDKKQLQSMYACLKETLKSITNIRTFSK